MGFIKRIFQLSLSKREIVRSKRFMAILMIPIFVIQMSSLNLFLMQAVIAEDGESDVVAESEEIKEAPPEEESAPDEIEKSDPPKEEVKPANVEEVSKESPADEDASVALEEIIPNSISEVIDEAKEEIPPVVAPEIIQEEAVENDEGGRITPEAAYDENVEAPIQPPVAEEPKVEEGWRENGDGSSSIAVVAGNEYEYKDSGLKIKFTRIDSGTGEITVKEIELTDTQIMELGALSNKAWDITSDMVDGTFEYELTLPVVENVDESKIQLVYVEEKEDLNDEEKIKAVEKEDVKVDNDKNELVANGLDHFTVYLVKEKSINENLAIASSGVTIVGGCMEDIAKKKLTCTANDAPTVGVTDFTILDDGCKSPDDTVEFSAIWSFKSNASQRYNIGLYFATGGQSSALNGTCSVSILPNSPVPPWFNFDGNICGDIASEATVYPETTMTVECLDSDGDNKLNVPYCSSWEQNSSICNGPADTIPGAPSKCSCDDGFEIPITVPYKAQIEVIKDLIPSTDEGRFNLQIDGVDKATNVGDGGTTGKVIVGAGTSEDPGDTHIVSESAYGGTNISDYTSSISCVNRGTNTFDGGSPLVVSGVGPLSVPVEKDDDIVCTATNSINKATITINKIVKNDNGGGATINDFQAKLDGNSVSWATPIDVLPGTHIVSETNLPGYTATFSGDCDGSGSIMVNSQENKICTITNDDQPGTLIVKKEIIKDNGGDNTCGDFSFNYGIGAINFQEDCQNEIPVPAGIYNVTETPATGYATTYENCTNISVPNGGSATCTIKNDDIAPNLTVIKKVINDNGGNETVDAFEIKMNDSALSFGAGVPSIDMTAYTSNPIVTANTSYTLSEKDLAGYTEGTWSCKTVTGASVAYPVTLTEGQDVICEITNDDIAPTITLIKEVINNNGGQAGVNDFGLSIGGVGVTSGQVYPVEANTAYALNEIGLSGYEFVSITGDGCPANLGDAVTLNEGGNITCTIKNDDKSGKLTVIKIVDNKFGGNLNSEDFTINVSGTNPSLVSFLGNKDGTIITLDAGIYNVTENLIDGYVPNYSANCKGTISIGDEKTCTITNEDQAPKLTLIKTVVNDNGGTKQVSDFSLTVGNIPVTSGVATTLASNIEYTVSETNLVGYTASVWSGACSADGKITLKPGDNKTCYITNDDIEPKLTVNKIVKDGPFGDLDVADFPLYVGATQVTSGIQNGFRAGSYVISEINQPGYVGEISGECDANGNVILNPGDVKSCTITNTDNQGKIIIEKQTLPDGDAQLFAFSGGVSGQIADGGTLEKIVVPGNYSVSEIVPSGWDLTSLVCNDENSKVSPTAGNTANVNVEANETVKCTFTNTKRGNITIKKDAINNDPQDFEFTNNFENNNPATFYLDDDGSSGSVLPKSRTFEVLPGEYAVSETPVVGWQQEDATCDNGETIDSINVEPGENITCTFVNEKYAKIILVKNTIGGDGNFDFDAMGDGLLVDIDLTTINGMASQTFENLDQDNTYSIAENVPTNWNLTSAICTGDGNTPDKITPEPGETVTCTFTNTKKSNLTVVKKVINDNGGIKTVDDFGINFSGGALNFDARVSLGSTTTYTSQTLTVNPGSHNLFENDVFGYTEGVWDCGAVGAGGISTVVSLAPGENKTCTIINDDVAPTITLNKNVTGGIAGVNEFGLTIGDVAVNSGVKTNVSANTPIALNEAGLDGYTFTSLTGDEGCPEALGGTVTLKEGEEISCTITNTRDTGNIQIAKLIDIDGDLATTEDRTPYEGWVMDVDPDGQDTSDPSLPVTDVLGQTSANGIKTGIYWISEENKPGYDVMQGSCTLNGQPTGNGGIVDSFGGVEVAKDTITYCTFINTPNGTIHGYKWEDLSGNRERDCKIRESDGNLESSAICEEEDLLSGWTINLYRGIGDGLFETEPFKTMETDSGSEHFGWYWFEHLLPGQYKVCEVLEDSWTQTYPNNDGGNCHIVNLPDDNSNGFNESLNAVWGPEYNFGNFELGRIKACKYEDMNGNGQKDAEDFPLKNIDIQLYDYPDDWRLSDTKSTGEDGCVIFEDLQVGKYKVEEDVDDPDLSGYYQSFFPQSFEYEIISGSDENNAVFLNSKYRTISGYKFNDLNSNGIWEELEGETPLGGWTIYLDGNFNKVYDLGETSTTTNANGYYEFTDLVSDSYRVGEFLSPIQAADGWVQTTPVSGFYDLDLHSVIISMGNNFGNVQLSDIHGYKWSDLNGNGERDCIEEGGEDFRSEVFDDSEMYQCELEPLLSGWTINLYKSNGEGGFGSEPIRTTVTDSSSEHFGWYWFEDLPLGDYKVCEVLQNDWRQTHPLNSDDNCHIISLPSGNSNGFDLPAILNAVDGPVYSFGNQQLARITVVKFEDSNGDGQKDEGEDTLSGWEINLSGQDSINTNENGEVMFDKLLPESYELSETLQPGWNQTNIYCEDNNGPGAKITSEGEAYGHHGNCEGWNQCGDAETCAQWACRVRGYSSLVSYGESRPCTQFNNCHLFQHNVISAPPILSINPSYQDNEYIDYDWGNSCDVMGVTDIICNNPGFSEAAILSEDDSESDLVSENNYRLALNAGDLKTCYVGNQFVEPKLTILKYNNQWPNVQSQGSIIDYTIEVKALENNVNGVVVTDLPPEGFKYLSGSWSASSSLGGGHIGNLKLDHIYASPGVWDLGDMKAGEVVTLSYKAQIDGDQQPGLYNDLAWAEGADDRSVRVLATSMPAPAVDPGEITDNFVGTQIELAVAPAPQNVELEEDEEIETKTKKKVLGVTTYLPATGTPTMWIILALVILIAGIGLIIFARRKNSKFKDMTDKTLMLLVIVTGMIFVGSSAQAMAPAIRLSQPDTPTEISNQEIGFVVLDIEGRAITVDCYKKGASDLDWVKFSTVNLQAGGSSGACFINLNADGLYDFYAEASADGEKSDSAPVSLSLNTAVPGTPLDYDRDDDSCTINFKTANDGGLTKQVVMYRSKNAEFIADESTRVQSGDFGSDVSGSLTDSNGNCDDYLYAIQAVSGAGIGSDFVGDEDVDVETRTRTRTVYEENIVYTGGGAIPTEGTTGGAVTEEATETTTEGEVLEGGAVQGEATEGALSEGVETDQGKVAGIFSEKNSKWGWILVGLAALGSAYYIMRRKSKKKIEIPNDED